MADHTKIEWCDATFNPWVGCTRLSPACDFCYAESWARRTGQPYLWNGERRRTTAANWQQPHKWNRVAQAAGVRKRVFCASLADVFDNQIPERWRDDLWFLIDQTPWLDWMLLTKRPQNVAKMLPNPATGIRPWGDGWANVLLGTTVESAKYLDRFWHLLPVAGDASRTFISYEPALGPLGRLTDCWHPGDRPPLSMLICGGESGPNARPMHPDWARDARDQCAAMGVPFFFKQHGQWKPIAPVFGTSAEDAAAVCAATEDRCEFVAPDGSIWPSASVPPRGSWIMERVGKKAAGAILDGREWREMPAGA